MNWTNKCLSRGLSLICWWLRNSSRSRKWRRCRRQRSRGSNNGRSNWWSSNGRRNVGRGWGHRHRLFLMGLLNSGHPCLRVRAIHLKIVVSSHSFSFLQIEYNSNTLLKGTRYYLELTQNVVTLRVNGFWWGSTASLSACSFKSCQIIFCLPLSITESNN